jgi:phosphoglycolate phosphatase
VSHTGQDPYSIVRPRGGRGRLVLWDVDHTLIHLNGVGLEAYAAAFTRLTGRPWRGADAFTGRTERAAAVEILRAHGVESGPPAVRAFLGLVEEEHRARAGQMVERGQVLPGAAEALAALAATDGVRQTVLTGNLRAVALLKLDVFGLDRWLDVTIGAFGDEDVERAALVPRACRNAKEHRGEVFGAAHTVLIGDSVRDVEAAAAHGAGIVGVATGTTSAAALRGAGARTVLDDLTDTSRVLAAVHDALAVE